MKLFLLINPRKRHVGRIAVKAVETLTVALSLQVSAGPHSGYKGEIGEFHDEHHDYNSRPSAGSTQALDNARC